MSISKQSGKRQRLLDRAGYGNKYLPLITSKSEIRYPVPRVEDGNGDVAVRVTQAYRFALDPTRPRNGCSPRTPAARFAWNWALGRCAARYGAEGRWYPAWPG